MINNFINIIDKNSITLSELSNLDQDMRTLLNKNESIIYEKSNNLNINIDSKINHITFLNCKDINLNIHSLVSGIDIKNSENIKIKIYNSETTNSINIIKSSDVYITLKKEYYQKNIYNIDKSRMVYFKDENENIIKIIKKK